MMAGPATPYRPAEFCRRLLAVWAAAEGRRKRRARDTTPDAIGLALKRELIEAAIRDDPAPEDFEAWLLERCLRAGPATGGVRAMALSILEEWRLTAADPAFRKWLEEGAPSEDRDSASDSGPSDGGPPAERVRAAAGRPSVREE